MRIPQRLGMIALTLVIMLAGCSASQEPEPSASASPTAPSGGYVWGVDSASKVDEAFCQCIVDSYGEPAYFGRYLGTKEGVSYGITAEEVQLLHARNIKILPIYNHFTDATTYDRGKAEAERAVRYAREAGVPDGVYVFADIEPDYPVDSDFLRGWSDTMLQSEYRPGIYGVFQQDSPSNLLPAYLNFIRSEPEREKQVDVWTSDVDHGVSTKKTAPQQFNPEAEAYTEVDIWQYGIDGEACNIDTNLMRAEMMDYLW